MQNLKNLKPLQKGEYQRSKRRNIIQLGRDKNIKVAIITKSRDNERQVDKYDKAFFNQKAASTVITPEIKQLFSSMGNTSGSNSNGEISVDWLQLDKETFKDLLDRNKIRKSIDFKTLKDKPEEYDEVALAYIQDLKKTYRIPSIEEAALWSFKPSWYEKYGGDIDNIPKEATDGETGIERDVMQNRLNNLMKHMTKQEIEPSDDLDSNELGEQDAA